MKDYMNQDNVSNWIYNQNMYKADKFLLKLCLI